jgi:hypothetical protein
MCNPCVTRGSSFADDFSIGSESVFIDDFYAHLGCLRCRIQASPVEAVSLKISEAGGVVYAVEYMRHP